MNFLTRCSLALLFALGATAASAAAAPRQAEGERLLAPKAEAVVTFRAPALAPARMALGDLDITKIAEVQRRNRRDGVAIQIGVARPVDADTTPTPALAWRKVAGGAVARLEVASPDALGLRVGLKFTSIPAGLEVRTAGSLAPDRVNHAAGSSVQWQQKAGRMYWTPATDGDRQIIELYAPTGVDTGALRVRVVEVSHLLTNSLEKFTLAKEIGDSGACNVDVICRIPTLGQNFVNTKNAVARMVFTVAGDGTYTCTGTLLADLDAGSQIPYFWTADHCIGDSATASTLNTFWNFEATSCGGSVAAANTLRSGGAALLFSDPVNQTAGTGTDAALLRLNDTPPSGAYFNGWNANALGNTAVLAVHHPSGDLKKSSLGQKLSQDTQFHEAGWTSGTTEGGSSGSGLFTSTGTGGAYELRGGLYGGFASCDNNGNLSDPDNRDYYSRLDLVFDDVDQWLAATGPAAPGPTREYTGAWYVPAESGWGFTAFQFDNASDTLFILFFIYNEQGEAKWYELGGGWSATDVRSGELVESTANQPWGTTWSGRTFSTAGNATLTFTSATTATLNFTVDGVTRNVTVQKL